MQCKGFLVAKKIDYIILIYWTKYFTVQVPTRGATRLCVWTVVFYCLFI